MLNSVLPSPQIQSISRSIITHIHSHETITRRPFPPSPTYITPTSNQKPLNVNTYLKTLPNIITIPIPNPQRPSQPILRRHNLLRQRRSNAKEHEKRPLPPERVDRNTKRKPPDQL
jgi:hypothetical protein